MAISTYDELQTAVTNWLSRADANLVALIPNFITLAEGNFNRVLEVRQMETSDTLTPVSGVCTLPTDYLKLRRIYINTSVPIELEYMPPEQFYIKFPVTAGGSKYFTIEGDSIVLADRGSTTVKILYLQKIPALSVSNTTNWLLTAHPDLYLSAALSVAYDVMKSPLSQMWYQKAAIIVNEIMEVDKRGKYSGSTLRVIAS